MKKTTRLYLFTLEVDELTIGKAYNPLPAHLTLVSRFYSQSTPEEIAIVVNRIFEKTNSIGLLFEEAVYLGPKQAAAALIKPSTELIKLHKQVIESLAAVNATYANPQFVGDGWKPHVSKRAEKSFGEGDMLMTKAAYLIEVEIDEAKNQIRLIRKKFNLD